MNITMEDREDFIFSSLELNEIVGQKPDNYIALLDIWNEMSATDKYLALTTVKSLLFLYHNQTTLSFTLTK